MKRLFVFLIIIALALSSCSNIDSIELNGEDSKMEYSPFESDTTYVVNTNSLSYHKESCYIAKRISEENRWETKDESFLKERGYKRCGVCLK